MQLPASHFPRPKSLNHMDTRYQRVRHEPQISLSLLGEYMVVPGSPYVTP